MILNERDTRKERALEIANKLITAARTAPKTRGVDILEIAVITDDKIEELSTLMQGFEFRGSQFKMERDSANVLQAECVVLIGTKERPMGLNCGHCGFPTCSSRTEGVPCFFNGLDVGIALGSAVALAADLRVDTRLMFSVGLAAQKLDYMNGCTMIMAIPISISSKNPFLIELLKSNFDSKFNNNDMKSIPNKNNLIPSQAYLPAEWHAQSGVQLTWPHAGTDWEHMLHEVEECYLSLAREIAQRTILLISSPEIEQVRKLLEKSDVNMKNVRLFECSTNDTWTRDHGAITMLDGDKPYILDFTFNGWGLKFASCHDNLITRKLCKAQILDGTYINALSFVLEGGGIESDGEGTLLTTSNCLLSDNRNEEMTKQEIEAYLIKQFNLKQVLWLDYGYLAGDDTDSHIDTLTRLCSKDTIAYVKCDNVQDEHYDELKEMEKQLQSFKTLEGNPYKLIALPMADEVIFDMERLPATYANFLIMDQVVLYPTYNQPENDKLAKQALQEAFPNLEIIGIDCSPLIKQHGSLHCVTMQYPVGVLR